MNERVSFTAEIHYVNGERRYIDFAYGLPERVLEVAMWTAQLENPRRRVSHVRLVRVTRRKDASGNEHIEYHTASNHPL